MTDLEITKRRGVIRKTAIALMFVFTGIGYYNPYLAMVAIGIGIYCACDLMFDFR